jgi:hypothetical protein
MGMVASGSGLALAAPRALAWHYQDMPPEVEAALNAACGNGGEDHAGLISAGRQDLLRRIAEGLLPVDASERFACPVCGCSVMVTADAAP